MKLFRDNLAPKTIEGYRSAIAHTYRTSGLWDVGSQKEPTALIHSFYQERPRTRPEPPTWDLAFVLHMLNQQPYEPMAQASLEHVTLETAFLVAFASGRRRSELHALQVKGYSRSTGWDSITIHMDPSFVSKTHVARHGTRSMLPLTIQSLSRTLSPDMKEDKSLCPVRALRYYLDRTQSIRGTRERLVYSP
jgi:integrase